MLLIDQTFALYLTFFNKTLLLGLNMIEPPKPLIDSGLAVRFFIRQQQNSTKSVRKSTLSGAGQNKVSHPSHDVGAKIGIYFETTKAATIIADGGGSYNPINTNTMR